MIFRRGSSKNSTRCAMKAISRRRTVFFTRVANARRLDNYRRLLNGVGDDYRELLSGRFLSEASVHANTSGVFKGFYKDWTTGIGKFGGSNGDALLRIKGRIELDVPDPEPLGV